jgi:aspartyl/glutamyl-tRNA(Asn/Gln) amidotransferase C subunit
MKMSISEKELEHLAVLSKLKLSSEEKSKFLNNMDSIIDFLNQLKPSNEKINPKDEEYLRTFSEQKDFNNQKKIISNSTHQK